jgi:hypothetical protein
MEPGHALPARELPLPGESLASLLRRTAAAMGYDNVNLVTRLLGESYRPHQNLNWTGPGPHLDRLAALLRLAPAELLQGTVHRFAGALVLRPAGSPAASLCDGKTALRFFAARTVAFCPTCLATDARPYERLLWSFRPLGLCTRHARVLLARCAACGHGQPPGRSDPARCRCGAWLARQSSPEASAPALACARTLEAGLQEGFRAVPHLSSAAGFWLAERLAVAVGRTPAWVRRTAERFALGPPASPDLLGWTAAAEILSAWPDGLYQFLDEFQRVAKNQTLSTGVGRAFGRLLQEVGLLEGTGYGAPAQALRQYLLERYAGPVNRKVGLFRSQEFQGLLGQRPWYTQTEAAEVLRLRLGTVADLVRQGILDGQIDPAGSKGRSVGVVRKASVEALQQSLRAGLNVFQAQGRLGLGRSQVLNLLRAGLLGAVRTRGGWVIFRESVEAIEALCRGLPRLGADRSAWLSLRQATRVFGPSGLSAAAAVELVRAGRVAARSDGRHRNLRGLWLSRNDLLTELPALRARRQQTRGYALSQLGKVLLPGRPCREPVLKKWIRAGLLQVRKRGPAWVASREEVECFRREFCLADAACSILRVSRSTLSRWESAGRLTPVYGKRTCPHAGFSLYRRADVVALAALGGGDGE